MKTQRDDLQDRFLDISFAAELEHGIVVSNLAYDVAKELGLSEDFCYQLAIAEWCMTSVSLNWCDILKALRI